MLITLQMSHFEIVTSFSRSQPYGLGINFQYSCKMYLSPISSSFVWLTQIDFTNIFYNITECLLLKKITSSERGLNDSMNVRLLAENKLLMNSTGLIKRCKGAGNWITSHALIHPFRTLLQFIKNCNWKCTSYTKPSSV